MNRMLEPPARPSPSDPLNASSNSSLPILSAAASTTSRLNHSSSFDRINVPSSPVARMRPPAQSIPEDAPSIHSSSNGASPRQMSSSELKNKSSTTGHQNQSSKQLSHQQQQQQQQQPSGAAAAAQQPKVVQTAFIHKLYSMLQDPSIQHLITWSNSNESFLMNPSSEFSKVLSQYFKHTNISSFVRQLNMYGFHKVSDVFHTGSPESTMWEFKHGNGNFKKGDVAGLREIKRRASRHTLIHRDSFSTGHKGSSVHHANNHDTSDAPDARLSTLEHSVMDMYNRLSRLEEANSLLSSRCQGLTESLMRCHQWSSLMAYYVTSLVPENNPMRQDVANMHRDILRQLDVMRSMESPHEPLMSGRPSHHFGAMPMEHTPPQGPPLSPRQTTHDDGRRLSTFKPPMPQMAPQLNVPHRYSFASPSHTRPPPPPPAHHQPHPLSNVTPNPVPSIGIGRRHTSADIREHGWGVKPAPSPFNPPAPSYSSHWPSSPHRDGGLAPPVGPSEHQNVRDMLARYDLSGSRRAPEASRHITPPSAPSENATPSLLNPESSWSLASKLPHPTNSSVPATRRSSMASNVHSLLNPADTNERDEEEMEDRKRKRLQ